jgi:hypothetical protein
MITATQLALVCGPLQNRLEDLGFAFGEVEFDEVAETLRIAVSRNQDLQLSPSPASRQSAATIDARLLWDLLRDLVSLGVMTPAIQLVERTCHRHDDFWTGRRRITEER